MSEWKTKRFWTAADVVDQSDGFGVSLDGRPVKTPAKTALIVPSRALAQAIADEWQAQDEEVNPLKMPLTRSANAAIDKVANQHGEVADLIAAYGDSDLLCYRADGPERLVARQNAAWDPLLDWAADRFGARLQPIVGVMHISQTPSDLAKLSSEVHAMDAFTLTAFHDLVSLSGSLIIGFAALEGWKTPEELWQISRVDEIWQSEQWGTDEAAQAAAEYKLQEFVRAKMFHQLLKK